MVEQVDAKKKLGREEALELVSQVEYVIVAKGKSSVTFAVKDDPPDETELLTQILGRTGNLRAPTLRKGNTLLVGFNDALYREHFG